MTVNVINGQHFPLFILRNHTISDWNQMIKNIKIYRNRIKGIESLITLVLDSARRHMKNIDPVELLKKHDEAIRVEHRISRLYSDEFDIVYGGNHLIFLTGINGST